MISFLGTGLHATAAFPRGVRTHLALREAVRDESWTWSDLAHHVNKQHAPVSARDVVAGDAPPWTGAQVRQLGARHAFSVGRTRRGLGPAQFRLCSIAEPNLPAAGHTVHARKQVPVQVPLPATSGRDTEPELVSFGPLPGLLTFHRLEVKADKRANSRTAGPAFGARRRRRLTSAQRSLENAAQFTVSSTPSSNPAPHLGRQTHTAVPQSR